MNRSIRVVFALAASIGWTAAAMADDGIARGRQEFQSICALCHTDQPGRNKIGPSLFGVYGRKAGSATGFNYSSAMRSAAVTWDDATLDRHIADPRSVVPGNRMTFAGLKNPDDRHAVIAYLKTLH